MSEDIFVVNVNDDEYESVDILDIESDIDLDERVHVIEVEDSESRTVETFDAFNALGEPNEQLKHQLLNGRDAADQHPIAAITGLKDKLDDIEALKTVYSNEKQSADYYEWEDGNVLQESRIGYFVSLCPDSKSIKICDGSNVFGVVVDSAAFVGGQTDIPRDYKYGLVTSVGYALVRCEMDVQVGNCVIPNSYGMAQNTSNNYGCRVIGINNINGVRYALVSLNVSIDQIDSIGDDVKLFDERLDKAEGDIVSAINVANQAHNKAQDIEHTSNEAIDKSNQAINKSEEANTKAENAFNQSQSSFEASARAEALAQSAAVTTETAKQTFVDVKKQVEDVSAHISDVETDLQESKSNIAAMEEDLKPLAEWKDDSDPNNYGISGFVAKADENEAQLGLLASFEYGNNQNIYPYTNTPANDEGVNITGDVLINGVTFTDKGDTSVLATGTASNNADFYIVEGKSFEAGEYCIFGCPNDGSIQTYCILFKQEKTDGTIESFISIGENQLYEYEVDGSGNISLGDKVDRIAVEGTNIISIWIRISSGATVNSLNFVPCLKKYYKGISGLRNQVAKNGSSIDLLTSHSFEGGSGTAGLILQVSANSAQLNNIALWQTETTKAISSIEQNVSENYAKKTEITGLIDEGVSDAKTGILDEVSKTYATQESFTNYQNSINNSFTSIKQQSDADGASIRLLASSINKHSVGEYSQAYGFTLEQAREVLEEGMVYVPTVDHTETYAYTTEVDGKEVIQQYPSSDGYHFTTGYVYKWERIENGTLSGYMWTEHINQVAFSGIKPITQIPYWYTNVADGLEDGYEPYVLYKAEYYTDENGDPITRWISVATLQGNSQNRAMSQIRQDANSIDLKVTDVQGSVAGLEASVEKAETSIGLVVAKTDGGEVINAASIVTAINNQTNETAINLNADRINLEGLITANETFSIDTDGYMRAIGGTIGGWTITDKTIYYHIANPPEGYSPTTMGLTNESPYSAAVALWSGWTGRGYTPVQGYNNYLKYYQEEQGYDLADAQKAAGDLWKSMTPFYVTHGGFLHATNANISGVINSNEGNIGGWTLRNGYLTSSQMADIDGYNVKATTSLRAVPEDPMKTYGVLGIRKQYFAKNDGSMHDDHLALLIDSEGRLYAGDGDGNRVTLYKGYVQFYRNALTGTPVWCGSLSSFDNGILFNGNNKKIYGQFTDGSKVDMIYVNSSNQIVIGGEGNSNLNGVKIYHSGAPSKSTSFNSMGIVFQYPGMELRGYNKEDSTKPLHMMSIRDNDELWIGTTVENGIENVNIYTQYGKYINFYNGANNVCSIYTESLRLNGTYGICIDDTKKSYVLRYNGSSVEVGTSNQPLNLYGKGVYSNGLSLSSDRRLKNTINDLSEKYISMIDLLSAKSYRYNEYRSSVTNCGFIAQDVISALSELGLNQEDFGGVADVYEDGSQYALDYTQFIPILWENVKKLKKQVNELEVKLEEKGE